MRRALAGLVLALATVAPLAADVAELKSGPTLEGTVKQLSPAEVVIDVAGKETKLRREDVRSIQKRLDSPPPPAKK